MLSDKECAFVNFAHIKDSMMAWEGMQGGRLGSTAVRIGYGKTNSGHPGAPDDQPSTKSLCKFY